MDDWDAPPTTTTATRLLLRGTRENYFARGGGTVGDSTWPSADPAIRFDYMLSGATGWLWGRWMRAPCEEVSTPRRSAIPGVTKIFDDTGLLGCCWASQGQNLQ
jgi:hypothetical protein